MMKLSTMKKVTDTVDENWNCPTVEKMLEAWGYDNDTVKFFRASANFVFIFKKLGKTYFFRFNDSIERELKNIEEEIKLINYLAETDLDISKPVKSLNGNYVETFNTEIGTFHGVVFEGLKGKLYETDELNINQYFNWGKALGNFHEVVKNVPKDYKINRDSWKEHLAFAEEILSNEKISVREELKDLTEKLNDLDRNNDNFGLIHYDFELDNLIWKDEAVSILDFDDCSYYWYAADIVYALRDLIEEGNIPKDERYQKFIEGYKSETNIDESILKEIPLFIRLHNIVSLAEFIQVVDIEESPDYPKWILNLRKRFLNEMEELRETINK